MTREEAIFILKRDNPNNIAIRSGFESLYDQRKEAFSMAIKALEQESNKSEIPTGSTTKNDPEVDCISRQAVLEIYDEWFATCNIADKKESPKAKINALPKVTPIRPKGHWINHSDEGYVECPKCGSATNCDDNIADLHFCFSCGAKMEDVEE